MILFMQLDYSKIVYSRGSENDPEEIIEFWKKNNITVTKTDNPRDLREASRIYPRLFIVARYGTSNSDTPASLSDSKTGRISKKIVGTVWGNYDGRRGYIVHLAVETGFRSQGLGRELMERVEEEFHNMGIYKIHLFVESHNQAVGAFYDCLGYKKRNDLTVYSKTLG